MSDHLTELREACAKVALAATHVRVNMPAIARYAASLQGARRAPGLDGDVHLASGTREQLAAYWLTLDAINFGSGWFPTLRKPEGRSGYETIARGLRERFERRGPWPAAELTTISSSEVAAVFVQDPGHELMELFARSLRDLGRHVADDHRGSFTAVVDGAGHSATALVERLAEWNCFKDVSLYDDLRLPFLKRAQIAAADVHRAGLAAFADLDRLTMFADNLVPHVLRLDRVLEFEPALVERIERGELIKHGSPEEVEIRACAVHAVELLTSAAPGLTAAEVDQELWLRGRGAGYKAVPRHRSRCTAY
jgi:putative queuosine salvage protein